MSGLQSEAAEVGYEQMEVNAGWRRFRHVVRFVRWRPDRDPVSCAFGQLDTPVNYNLFDVVEVR